MTGISKSEVKAAAEAAYEEYGAHMSRIRTKGAEILEKAYAADMPVIVLAGRPYHIDGEINHGIDRLICDYGAAVISEDAVSELIPKFEVGVLNQWTYHSRMYCAAKYVAKNQKNIPNSISSSLYHSDAAWTLSQPMRYAQFSKRTGVSIHR